MVFAKISDRTRGKAMRNRKGALAAVTVFFVAPAGYAQQSAESDTDTGRNLLEEVVVTAQKREETILTVPVPVTAITAESLTENNQYRIQEYFSSIPGLAISASELAPSVAIRGVISGAAATPTVGIILDDLPMGSSTQIGGGYFAPEIDPADLARVEVLRGPQGTLYGASSMGGLLKYVTIDPSTKEFSGSVRAGTNTVASGGSGYNLGASLNIPMGETFAVRVSGFGRHDAGFIDNLGYPDFPVKEKDVNDSEVYGGRVSALWAPNDDLSIKLGAIYQKNENGGYPYVSSEAPPIGELEQRFLPRSGENTRTFTAYSANINYSVGGFDLVSVTGFSTSEFTDFWDYSSIFGDPDNGVYVLEHDRNSTDKFTQEFRAAKTFGEKIDVLIGAYFGREDSTWDSAGPLADVAGNVLPRNPETPGCADFCYNFFFDTAFDENSFFTNLTYHFTDRFDVQVGARTAEIKQKYAQVDTFYFEEPPFVDDSAVGASKDRVATYLFTPRFKVSDELMVYGRFATGYRAGGFNAAGLRGGDGDGVYAPDKTQNYEIGVKGTALGNNLTFDASIYHIDWSDIQVLLQPLGGGLGLVVNGEGKTAKSEGIELSAQFFPTRALSLEGWVTLSKATLTKDFSSPLPGFTTADGKTGDRLPYSSEVSGYVAANYAFDLGQFEANVGGNVSYVGDRFGDFLSIDNPEPRQVYKAYTQLNLTSGLKAGEWDVGVYVNNVTDKRGYYGGGTGSIVPKARSLIQPRSMGLTLVKSF
jgi:iron complex outermembrane recepter protein